MLRHTTTRAHGFPPYTLITGQHPRLPTILTPYPENSQQLTSESDERLEVEYLDSITARLEELHRLAISRRFKGYQRLLQRFRHLEKNAKSLEE
jgi:hypothetical protein